MGVSSRDKGRADVLKVEMKSHLSVTETAQILHFWSEATCSGLYVTAFFKKICLFFEEIFQETFRSGVCNLQHLEEQFGSISYWQQPNRSHKVFLQKNETLLYMYIIVTVLKMYDIKKKQRENSLFFLKIEKNEMVYNFWLIASFQNKTSCSTGTLHCSKCSSIA